MVKLDVCAHSISRVGVMEFILEMKVLHQSYSSLNICIMRGSLVSRLWIEEDMIDVSLVVLGLLWGCGLALEWRCSAVQSLGEYIATRCIRVGIVSK
jgi:hypothetical protein